MSDSRQTLVIYGAWYFGNVIKEAAEAAGWQVLGYVDPDPPDGVTTIESIPLGAAVFVAIGDNKIRAEVTETLLQHGRSLPCIAHPSASISPSAQLGPGSYVAELAIVRTNAIVGEGVVLQAGCVVSHDCTVAPYASFGPNSAAASKVTVGQRTVIGAGAVIAPTLTIGDDCTVAAGAAIFRNADDNRTLVGNPARATPSPTPDVIHSDWSSNDVW